jgi:hypothetical protein
MFSKLKSALLFAVLLCVFAYMGMSCGAPAAPKMQALHDSLATVELVPYKGKNGKWGLSTLSHQVVLACEYDDVAIEEEFPQAIFIKQGEYWYVFDRKGNAIIAEGYKYISFRDDYWHLTKKEKGTVTLRDASGQRTIAEGYNNYYINGDWILAHDGKIDGTHILDTTGKLLSKEVYSSVRRLYSTNNYALVSLYKKDNAIFSPEKGVISDYVFSTNVLNASDYIVAQKDDTIKTYKSYEGKTLDSFNILNQEKDYIIHGSLLLPINTSFSEAIDSLIIDSAISHTGNKQLFSYKYLSRNINSFKDVMAFSVDNGKTYHFIVGYYMGVSTPTKYTLTAEELATVYSAFDIDKGQYIVLKDGKYGVWSAKTKKMLIAAEYDKVHHIKFVPYITNEMKMQYPYSNRLILTNDKGGILFDPKNESSQNISGFDMPINNIRVENIFADYLYISDYDSKYHAIYSIKAGKVLGKLNSAFRSVVNQSQKLFYLDSINGGMPLMQIKPNNELVQLAIVPNLKYNAIDFAWDNGLVGKNDLDSDEIIWYDFAGEKVQAMDFKKAYVYDYGIIEDKKTIYNTKLEKVDYTPKGEIYARGSVIVDVYGKENEDGRKSERVYLDWSGKRYAEE